MKDTAFITSMLALQCWRDGKDEGFDAMMGIAFTIRNRVRAGWYGGNWLDILAHHQEWSATTATPSIELPDPRINSFMKLLQQIDGVFNGMVDDNITIKQDGVSNLIITGPPPVALYYGRMDKIDNPWFLENISRKGELHPRIAQVGLISFFA
jgi:hypothetical protein